MNDVMVCPLLAGGWCLEIHITVGEDWTFEDFCEAMKPVYDKLQVKQVKH